MHKSQRAARRLAPVSDVTPINTEGYRMRAA